MDATTAAVLGGVAALLVVGIARFAVLLSDRQRHAAPVVIAAPTLPPGVGDVVDVLRSSAIVLDAADAVVNHSPPAIAHGLVRGGDLVHRELLELARAVRRDGEVREGDLVLARTPGGERTISVNARVAPLGSHHVLILVEDRTHALRVEEIRRDFVANVSHELKTPISGLSLLAEAVQDAADDPEAVARFAGRMRLEAGRLARLVQDIVDLSRLQALDALGDPKAVDVAAAAREASDRARLLAEAKDITITISSEPDCIVFGDQALIVTAISNLVVNAIAYSEPRTRVTIAALRRDRVEVRVTDQGCGISAAEQERVFERFYRVDAARSRATGGTGLGLSIVKHVCSTHGGEVRVWSEPGRGSTFTISLPSADARIHDRQSDPALGRDSAAEGRPSITASEGARSEMTIR